MVLRGAVLGRYHVGMMDGIAAHGRAFGRRALAAVGLRGPAAGVFKSDGRSRVWLTSTPSGTEVVVKQFEHSPFKQRLSLLLGRHPVQRELRGRALLAAANVPAVPVFDAGWEPIGRAGWGCRAWLATPLMGRSINRRLADAGHDDSRRETWIDAAADLAKRLIAAGLVLKDFKPSNIIIDDAGGAWLIDTVAVCSCRGRRRNRAVRMAAVMDRALARDGVEQALRDRFAARVRTSF